MIAEDNISIKTNNDDIQSFSGESSTNQFAFEDKTYGKKTYLYRLVNINYSKNFYFLIGGLTVVLLIIIIIIGIISFQSSDNEKTNDANLNLLSSLIISDNNNIWAFDVHKKTYEVLQSMENEITALDTYIDETVFWCERNTLIMKSLRNQSLNIAYTEKWKPQAIAIDYVTDKIYLVDKSSDTLNVIDINNKYYGVVISDLTNPHDIAVDLAEGLMFILELSKAIVKANMDGTWSRRIIESTRITAITIDRKAARVYWSNDAIAIESSDYNGYSHSIVTPIPMGVFSLTIFENQLFWTRSSNWSDVCPCTNILWSCIIHRRTCANITYNKLSFEHPRILRTSYDQHRHLIKNPCEHKNGNCEQLCLLTSKGSHDCACNTGWKLNPDARTCSNVTDLILYVQEGFIRGKILNENKEAFTEAIVPTPYYVEKLNKKPLIHFDYDMVNGNVFFSDDHSIYKINVVKNNKQIKIYNTSEDYKIRDIAFDWMKGCIYFVKESQDPANNHSIEMMNVNSENKAQKTILTSKYKKEHYIACPFFLVIHPSHEYLFYTEYNGMSDNLQRIGTNGKGLRLLKPLYDFMYNLLAIDLDKSRLYWTTTADPSLVKSANIDGTEEKNVQIRIMTNPSYIGLHGDWMYVSNYTEIWRVHSETGDNATRTVRAKFKNNQYMYIHGLGIFNFDISFDLNHE